MAKTLIVGLGITGVSFVQYGLKKGWDLWVWDTRPDPPGLADFKANFPDVPLLLGDAPFEDAQSIERVLLSPGVSPHLPLFDHLKTNGTPFVSDIELFAREATKPILAITGTNGKSTVTALVGHLLAAAGFKVEVGGNIGTPALSLLNLDLPDYYVLECSSFQLETTHFFPCKAATILNLSPDHLDRHRTFENYIKAKQRIYDQCQHPVFCHDDPNTKPIGKSAFTSFGMAPQLNGAFGFIEKDGQWFLGKGQVPLYATEKLKVKGRQNWLNALAALALLEALALDLKIFLPGLATFQGLPHRCSWVREYEGVVYINDSKGTNVGATISALQSFGEDHPKKIILIAGGQGKGADFTLLAPIIHRTVKHVILMGEDAKLIQRALPKSVPLTFVGSMEAAVEKSRDIASFGDLVLLSPACASFDMFQDFKARGLTFERAVKALS